MDIYTYVLEINKTKDIDLVFSFFWFIFSFIGLIFVFAGVFSPYIVIFFLACYIVEQIAVIMRTSVNYDKVRECFDYC